MHVKDFDQYSELIAKFLAGESSLAEKEELFSWTKEDQANQQFFEEMEQVWSMTEGADTSPFEADMDTAWAMIDQSTVSSSQSAVRSRQSAIGGQSFDQSSAKVIPLSKKFSRWSIAAAILLLAAFGLWWMGQQPRVPLMVEVQTVEGEKKEIPLPDGSKVWLNENSKLSYPENFAERNVALEGEAFFDVEPMEESPFTISSGEATTSVLGTSFNVRAYPKEEKIEVTVETGTVALAVTNQAATTVKLPAGTSGIVHKKEATVERVEEKLQNAVAWKTLKLDFDEDLMKDVITTLERYFGTEIKVSNEMILECRFTSPFDQPNLDEILEVVSASVGVEIKKDGSYYILMGNGCEPDN